MGEAELEPVELTPEMRGRIADAIRLGYDLPSLQHQLLYRWGWRLADEVNVVGGFRYTIDELVSLVERQGRTLDLLALAIAGNPSNPRLRALAAELSGELAPWLARYGKGGLPRPDSLEALVSERSRLISFADFMNRAATAGRRLCRVEVETAGGRLVEGTGFLVDRDQVLTNFHVVKNAPPLGGEAIACRFDYQAEGQGGEPTGERVVTAEQWLLASSPYSASDLSGRGDPTAAELDYALLRLARPVGEERGWFPLTPDAAVTMVGDLVVIPQHARGEPASIAWGKVVELPAHGLRLRYDATTAKGASGAPCFSPDFEPIGLHHAADPDAKPEYNQAIPLWRIARDIAARRKGQA